MTNKNLGNHATLATGTLSTEVRKIVTVNTEAECFIVPNRAHTVNGFVGDFARERITREMVGLAEDNDIVFDPASTKLVEIWTCNDDSDNWHDHGWKFTVDDEVYNIGYSWPSLLPQDMLPEKEGDTITVHVRIPGRKIYAKSTHEHPDWDLMLNVELTASQTTYRYRNFGPWEEVMQRVVA